MNVPALQDRIKQARALLVMPDPVREIPKLKGVLKPVKVHVAELLAESKAKVRAVLEDEIARLQAVGRRAGTGRNQKADRADSGGAWAHRGGHDHRRR